MDNKFLLFKPTSVSLYGFLFLTFVTHAFASPRSNMIELEGGIEKLSSKAKLTFSVARQEVVNCERKKEHIAKAVVRYLKLWPKGSEFEKASSPLEDIAEDFIGPAIKEQKLLLDDPELDDSALKRQARYRLGQLHLYHALAIKAGEADEVKGTIAQLLGRAGSYLKPLIESNISDAYKQKASALAYQYWLLYTSPDEQDKHAFLWEEGKKAKPHLSKNIEFDFPYLKGKDERFEKKAFSYYKVLKEILSQTFSLYEVIYRGIGAPNPSTEEMLENGIKIAVSKAIPYSSLVLSPIKYVSDYFRKKKKKQKVERLYPLIENPEKRIEIISALANILPYRYSRHIEVLTYKDLDILASGGVELMAKYLLRWEQYHPECENQSLEAHYKIFLDGLTYPGSKLKQAQGIRNPVDAKKIKGLPLETLYPLQLKDWTTEGVYKRTWIRTYNGDLYLNKTRDDRKYGDRYDRVPSEDSHLKEHYNLCDNNINIVLDPLAELSSIELEQEDIPLIEKHDDESSFKERILKSPKRKDKKASLKGSQN